MKRWLSFVATTAPFTTQSLGLHWDDLHRADGEPLPSQSDLLWGWTQFHNGAFEEAHVAGMHHGEPGWSLAAAAACTYAHYVETDDQARNALLDLVVRTGNKHLQSHPERASTHYWHAQALSHLSRSASVAKVLAQGVGQRIRESLETALRLRPDHAAAHAALGRFHADIIGKVGPLIGRMTYGVRKETALHYLQQALHLSPHAPSVWLDYLAAMDALESTEPLDTTHPLVDHVAAHTARDAAEWLQLHVARKWLSA